MVVPVLQARGRVRTTYEGSTLRERFTGSPRLAPDHPAHRLATSDTTVRESASSTR